MPRRSLVFFLVLALLRPGLACAQMFDFVIPWDDDSDTAVSLRRLTPSPAGADGFVAAGADGHLATGAGRIRFWGVNLCFGADFPTHADAERLARHLAKYGVNIVRYHHMDMWDIWTTTDPDRVLDPVALDKLDYLFAELKQNGVYSDINLLVSRPFNRGTELPPDIDLVDDWKVRAALGFFDPAILDLQKRYARDLLTHVNPYTGTAYVDEPAVAFIEINNENGLVQAFLSGELDTLPPYYDGELNALWNAWLAAKYGSNDALKAAWGVMDEPPGSEMLANGDFASGALAPWNPENHDTAVVNAFVAPGAGPGGTNAAELDITSVGTAGWHVQFNQGGLDVLTDVPYTLSFSVRADADRTISVDMGMAHNPWQNLGFYAPLPVTFAWQPFSYTFALSTADANGRVNFSNMGLQLGTVRIAGVSLRRGGLVGLHPGEDLDTLTIASFKQSGDFSRTQEARRDWFRFLSETEETYWLEMKRYVEDTLGARSLVIGTVIGCSTPNIQADFPVIDTHAYWRHPSFPNRPWDPADWLLENDAMVNHPDEATVADLSMRSVLGRPHAVSEYNHPNPNTFQAEAFFFLAAYGSLQDWDALIPFAYSHRRDDWDTGRSESFFDVDQNPVKLASFIPAAAAFRRGDILPAEKSVVVPIDRDDEIEGLLSAWAWGLVNASTAGEETKAGFIHRVKIAVSGQAVPPDALAPGTTDVSGPVYRSDTGEIAWDTSQPGSGVLTVNAERTKMVVGYGGGQTFDLSGVRITPGASLQGGFSAIALTVTEGASFATAGRMVLTALGATENTGVTWYEYPGTPVSFPPAEGLAATLHADWGERPSRVEGIPATIRLPTDPAATTAFALDATGARVLEIPVVDAGGLAELTVAPSCQALWYEIEVNRPPTGIAVNRQPVVTTTGVSPPISALFDTACRVGRWTLCPDEFYAAGSSPFRLTDEAASGDPETLWLYQYSAAVALKLNKEGPDLVLAW